MGKIIPKECLKEQTPEPSKHTKKRVRIDEQLNEYISIENSNTSRRFKRKTTNPQIFHMEIYNKLKIRKELVNRYS